MLNYPFQEPHQRPGLMLFWAWVEYCFWRLLITRSPQLILFNKHLLKSQSLYSLSSPLLSRSVGVSLFELWQRYLQWNLKRVCPSTLRHGPGFSLPQHDLRWLLLWRTRSDTYVSCLWMCWWEQREWMSVTVWKRRANGLWGCCFVFFLMGVFSD